MGDFFVRYLPLLLLLAGVLVLLLTGAPWFSKGALSPRQARFRSLAAASPILDLLILLAVIGKPFLEHLQRNGWESNVLGPTPLLIVVAVFVTSLYAMIGAILFYFYRAIQNVNFFTGRRVRAPWSVLFMIVPIVNLVVTPYLQYFALQRSRAFADPRSASAIRAALLVAIAFVSVLVSVTCGYAGNDVAEGARYDAASLLVIGGLTGLAGGILTTRIVDGIARAQESYAARIGTVAGGAATVAKPRNRARESLRLLAAGVLLVVAALAALVPAQVSLAVRTIL